MFLICGDDMPDEISSDTLGITVFGEQRASRHKLILNAEFPFTYRTKMAMFIDIYGSEAAIIKKIAEVGVYLTLLTTLL